MPEFLTDSDYDDTGDRVDLFGIANDYRITNKNINKCNFGIFNICINYGSNSILVQGTRASELTNSSPIKVDTNKYIFRDNITAIATF